MSRDLNDHRGSLISSPTFGTARISLALTHLARIHIETFDTGNNREIGEICHQDRIKTFTFQKNWVFPFSEAGFRHEEILRFQKKYKKSRHFFASYLPKICSHF